MFSDFIFSLFQPLHLNYVCAEPRAALAALLSLSCGCPLCCRPLSATDGHKNIPCVQVYENQSSVQRVALSHIDNDAVKALVDGVCSRWHQFAEPGVASRCCVIIAGRASCASSCAYCSHCHAGNGAWFCHTTGKGGRKELREFKLSLRGATGLAHDAVSTLLRLPVLTELDVSGCSRISAMVRTCKEDSFLGRCHCHAAACQPCRCNLLQLLAAQIWCSPVSAAMGQQQLATLPIQPSVTRQIMPSHRPPSLSQPADTPVLVSCATSQGW